MRFALIGPTYPLRGGIAHYTTSLCQALRRDHEVILVSFSRLYPSLLFPGRTQKEEGRSEFSASVDYFLDSMNPLTWRTAGRIVGDFQPDAVVFQWWQPFFAPAYSWMIRLIKRVSSAPVLFLCHNVYPHERMKYRPGQVLESRLIRQAFRRADGFLVHSEKMEGEVRQFSAEATVRHIYHPVYDFYRRWEAGEPAKTPRKNLLFFGKIRRYKGLEVFLRSLKWLEGKFDFDAVVAGEFYVAPEPFKRLVDELALSHRVTWEDHYIPNDRVPRLFQRADLVVLPYLDATQSGVVPLAYEFDVPVIASDVGGLSEIVIHDETGYLFPAGDDRTLASLIVRFFEEEKASLFRRNIRAFKQRLSWQQVLDNISAFVPTAREKEGS